jgi:hypothetical protein
VSLLEDYRGSLQEGATESDQKQIHNQKSLEFVGSGRISEAEIIKKATKIQIDAYYWRTYDTLSGYVDLYEHRGYDGVKKSLFLSLYPKYTTIKTGWFIEDRVDSIHTGGLGDGVTVVFYRHKGTGGNYTVIKNQNQNDLAGQCFGDVISSFKWSKAAPTASPTKAPVPPVPLTLSTCYVHDPEW